MSKPASGTPFEKLLRRFPSVISMVMLLPFYVLCVTCIGLSMTPGILLFNAIESHTSEFPFLLRTVALGFAFGTGYFLYGLTLIFLIPLLNTMMRARLKPWRGQYHSVSTVRWYIHNGLTYIARYTFLEFITPTPLNLMFFRLMGMKIGDGVQLNSTHISDPSLVVIGDKVTIGGSAVIIGHYGVGGFLILSNTRIENGATVGLRAIVMGGATIGENAKILPNSVVMPKTKVPAGETWGGVPAQKIETRRQNAGEASDLAASGG